MLGGGWGDGGDVLSNQPQATQEIMKPVFVGFFLIFPTIKYSSFFLNCVASKLKITIDW